MSKIQSSTHVVYWTTTHGNDDNETFSLPCRKEFTDLEAMVKFTAELRLRRKNGEPISHITSSSEIAESVGELGVEGPPKGYDWRKRRP